MNIHEHNKDSYREDTPWWARHTHLYGQICQLLAFAAAGRWSQRTKEIEAALWGVIAANAKVTCEHVYHQRENLPYIYNRDLQLLCLRMIVCKYHFIKFLPQIAKNT